MSNKNTFLENCLQLFSDYMGKTHSSDIFYFSTLKQWVENNSENGSNSEINMIIQDILSIKGIEEIGDDAYKIPLKFTNNTYKHD